MEEQENNNAAEEMTSTKQGFEAERSIAQWVPLHQDEFPCDQCDYKGPTAAATRMHKARAHGKLRGQPRNMQKTKAYLAAKGRARTARLNALGLTARGKPRGEGRTPEKAREWQRKFYKKNKAVREALGLTIAEFYKLPRAERDRQRELAMKRGKAAPTKKEAPVVASNGPLPVDDRAVKFCPHCGWNIDATRKAQAFVDGRVA